MIAGGGAGPVNLLDEMSSDGEEAQTSFEEKVILGGSVWGFVSGGWDLVS